MRVRPRRPRDFGQAEIDLYKSVAPYTMTSPEAIYALAQAVRYMVPSEISVAIVECGVWKGGSMMAVGKTLLDAERTDLDPLPFRYVGKE